MIALKDDEAGALSVLDQFSLNYILCLQQVFYYSTVADTFAPKRRSVKHFESREKLPAGISAAFSMPNSIIYLFKEKLVCVRPLLYDRNPPYVWLTPRVEYI